MSLAFASATTETLTAVPVLSWVLAVSPVVLLLALVLWGRFSTIVNAGVTVAYSVVVAALAFGAGPLTVGVGLGKGAWVGLWILYVIWPALLMHHLASRVGMAALGRALSTLLPRRTENVLLLAWVLPSFIQGVSGFGTPIAVAAPLLVALGIGKARAVALPLIGYHWAVGFGSMGSSFYMGALTAHLDTAERAGYAASAAVVLGINCVLSGMLVALMDGGWTGLRHGWRMLATAGPVMALVQAGTVRLEPGIGALCAGASGIAVVMVLRRFSRPQDNTEDAPVVERVEVLERAERTNRGHGGSQGGRGSVGGASSTRAALDDTEAKARAAAVPYVLLGVVALAVFLPPALRAWAKGHLLIGPSFPSTSTSQGTVNDAVHLYNPIAVLGHPGTFLLIACAGSVLVWSRRGVWGRGAWGPVWRGALRQAWKSSPSVVLLASVAGVLVDSGMVRTVAQGAAVATGHAYPAIAPLVGALGSFITGSTTSSNALFSSLQADVAHLIGDRPDDLLAGQLAGGNIGNSLAPVVILLGLSAVGAARRAGEVLRMTMAPAAVLLVSAVATTCALVAVHR
ncbi:L-lactate permease [Phycicoccus sp. SLBN-51]|uniref:L-lactate permease n=1 Tax=Phycicoccus sp. SLBN-51 TaxID=2768447 RepID=UPI00116B9C29|nr:L-lactate permease [Phycicoccus sp. SLBN-51]TQJ49337.1 lactate permease [Phycicoccus sp. SLBN-51]